MREVGMILEGQAAYEAGRFNRGVARTNAIEAEREGVAEEADIREAAAIAMGRQVATQAAGGFEAGSGSALDALKQSAVNQSVDILRARRNARSRATANRVSGDIAYAQGANARTGAFVGAAASLLEPKKPYG